MILNFQCFNFQFYSSRLITAIDVKHTFEYLAYLGYVTSDENQLSAVYGKFCCMKFEFDNYLIDFSNERQTNRFTETSN